MDGWECVVKKDEFSKGDLCVYVEIDSVVPERPEFEFLRDRKFRVRTIRLRGQISQGLVLPISILPGTVAIEEGADVTEVLGITKYDPEAQKEREVAAKQPAQHKNPFVRYMGRFSWFRKLFLKSKRKGGFPEWIAKTDETRIQNLPELFRMERDRGTPFSVTEKIDGQSATYYLRKWSRFRYEFGVCSRNIKLETPDNSSYWTVAKNYNIELTLRDLAKKMNASTIVLQGEIIGPGIQGNKYNRYTYQFFAFNFIVDGKKYQTESIQRILGRYGISAVPIVGTNILLPETIHDLVEYANHESVLRNGQKREGVVMRNYNRDISFKVINPEFLLEDTES